MAELRVVAFNGSPRRDGNTAALVRRVFEELEREGVACELVQVGGTAIRGCQGCRRCSEARDRRCAEGGDLANDCIARMDAADGIVLASPTYFADVTAETKALIDRAGLVAKANGDMLRRKVGAAVVAARRGGAVHAFDTMNHFFLINQMVVVGSSYWNMGVGLGPGEVASDREGMRTMADLGRNMAWALKRLRQ